MFKNGYKKQTNKQRVNKELSTLHKLSDDDDELYLFSIDIRIALVLQCIKSNQMNFVFLKRK